MFTKAVIVLEYMALYRQWRPDIFDDVVGQEPIIRTLKNQISTGRISHAYLFCGSRGTGKTSTAKIFARAINCQEPRDSNPCGKCTVCNQISSGDTMDIIEIDAASNNGVDEIRDLREKIKYPPSIGSYRVYIIDEVHMLSMGAFNALLKTLEEPPDYVVFILATTEPRKLPSTVLSRCQRYDFKRIPMPVISSRLGEICDKTGISIEKQALDTIAFWSEGGMRDALSLLDQCLGFCGGVVTNEDVLSILGTADREFIFSVMESILEGDSARLLTQVNRLVEDGRDISVFAKDLVHHLRNLLMVIICNDAGPLLDTTQDILDRYKSLAQNANKARIIRAIDIISALEAEFKNSSQTRILLEIALVKICMPEKEDSFEALVDRISVLEARLERGIQAGHLHGESSGIQDRQRIEFNDDRGGKPEEEYNREDAGIALREEGDRKNIEKAFQGEQKRELDSGENKRNKEQDNKGAMDKRQIIEAWPNILKTIKKERMAVYTMLSSAAARPVDGGGENLVLVLPQGQEFFAAAIEKDRNREYIEQVIMKYTGRPVRIACRVGDWPSENGSQTTDGSKKQKGEIQAQSDEVQQSIVQQAYDIFGKELVEVVEDE